MLILTAACYYNIANDCQGFGAGWMYDLGGIPVLTTDHSMKEQNEVFSIVSNPPKDLPTINHP